MSDAQATKRRAMKYDCRKKWEWEHMKKKRNWTLVRRLPWGGHRIWKCEANGRIAVADHSGDSLDRSGEW